uniref:receptor protein-tyrosine kinase n=1 Tax=Leptobrachium leishanense TaxID=445787 RepID=A0A8C5QBC6_9ANUR
MGWKRDAAALTLLIAISVRFVVGMPVIQPEGDEQVVNEGESITLTCSGNHAVKWEVPKNSSKITFTRQDNSIEMKITKVTFRQTGTYRCSYKDIQESTSMHLFVKGSKLWYTPRDRVSVVEDTDAVLECLITNPSIPKSQITLKTQKDKKENDLESLNVTFNPHIGFTIHNVKTEFENIYICQAMVNGNPTNSGEITLAVTEEPKQAPSIDLDSYYIRIEGEPLHITCKISSSRVRPKVEWQHPAENVSTTSYLNYQNPSWIDISVLTIPAVKMTDHGTYTCVGKNNAGSSQSSTFLEVVERGYVKISTSQNNNIALKVGENVELKAEIKAYPSAQSWKWIHNNTTDVSGHGKIDSTGPYRNESTFTLNRIQVNESGTYTLHVLNSKASASFSFEIILFRPPVVAISKDEHNGIINLNCSAWGNPLPLIKWYTCSDLSCSKEGKFLIESPNKIHDDKVESVLYFREEEYNSSIQCMASNTEGTDSKTEILTLMQKATQLVEHKLFSPLLVATTLLVAVFIILTLFLLYKYKQKPKYEVRWQIVQACGGNNYTCIDPNQLPYNEKWEFPRNNLHFGKTLGAGAFGKVIEATAFGMGKDDSALRVAVKMLKPSAHRDEVEALMSELKILSHLGHHQNIVNLLGACTHGGPILVITEYCPHGDLLNFLRKKAEAMNGMFAAIYTNGDYKNVSMDEKYMGSDNYLEMKPVPANSNSVQGNSDNEEEDTDDHLPLDLHDLLNFSLQVAQGMSFLAEKSCIHRDVAARNVLVTQGRIAKICDFGLARDVENDSNYVVKGNARLPVKWMAPESIFDCIYTVQSDVWSYGILLWEIFSLGRSPYPGILVDRKFYKMVKDGYKMDCPDYAPLEIYHIMKACWALEPTQRPTFNEISDLINKQMGHMKHQDYTNIAQVHEEDECLDVKCDAEEPFIKGNNYQFC